MKKDEQLDRDDYQYLTSNGISVVKWIDKKEVFVASNYFDPEVSEEVTRGNKDGIRIRITCPLPIVHYNKYMGGVDLSDQKTKYYTIDRKSKRNWMRIFFRLFGVSLINSLIYYKNLSRDNVNTVEYISSISTALIGDYVGRKRAGRPLALNNQKKMRIEKNISETRNREKLFFVVSSELRVSTVN